MMDMKYTSALLNVKGNVTTMTQRKKREQGKIKSARVRCYECCDFKLFQNLYMSNIAGKQTI